MNADFAIDLGMFFLRAGLLLACFWIVYGLLRSNPRARVMLCRIVSVAIVLLPVLNFVPMPAILSLPAFHQARIEQAPPAPHEFAPSEPVVRNEAPSEAVTHDNLPLVIQPSPVFHTPAPPIAPAPVHAWKFSTSPAPGTLATMWLAAVCFFLFRRGVAILMARRLATAAQTPPDWVLEEGRNLCARLGIRGKVTFGVAGKICSPLLLGPAPVILLPSHLVSDDSTADAYAALAHELVHVKQKDWHWSQWLHCVAVVTWPLPLAWFLRRAHDAPGELVCDHLAAESAGGAESYAGSLARQSLHAIGHPLPATMPMLRKSGIRRRIDLLLSGVRIPSLSWRVTLGATLLTLLAGGLLGGLQLARAAGNTAKNESPAVQDAEIKKEVKAFAPRVDKATDLGPGKYDSEMRSIRAALDKVPQPERTWVALWLNNTEPLKLRPDWWNHEPPRPLYSDAELVEMCRKIGPDALMKVLKAQRFPGDDPDLQNLTRGGFVDTAWFILDHAVELLRPQDSEALLALNSGKNKSQAWLIAAARLQPAKALGILRPAYAEFTGPFSQAKLSVALWQTCGETQTSFIVDKFYELAQFKGNFPDGAGGIFVEDVSTIEKPPGRKLIAAILQDKRLDAIKMDWLTFLRLAQAINGWTKKPVLSGPEIAEFSQTFVDHKEDDPANIQKRKDLLDRLRDSAPEWINAGSSINETAKPENPIAQKRNAKEEFETMAREFPSFDLADAFERRAARVNGDDAPKYRVFMGHFFAIFPDKDELIPLLKHKDPKVRSLAIGALICMEDPTVLPFIADLISDDAASFSKPDDPQKSITVGEYARTALSYYLGAAGYTVNSRKDFDAYWSTHKDRAWCASWFELRRDGALWRGPDLFNEVTRSIRADIAKIPLPDRAWTAMWVNSHISMYKIAPGMEYIDAPLYTQEELLDMCRKIAPETWMKILKEQRYPSDDPDLRNYVAGRRTDEFRFILEHAGALLRPEDSEALLAMNTGNHTSPFWFIAAAQVQPTKAAEIYRQAFNQFKALDQFQDAVDQLDLCTALWQLSGESQTSFIVDKFYEIAQSKPQFSGSTGPEYGFISGLTWIEKPPGRKLIAAILQDKKLDVLGTSRTNVWTAVNIARAINGWAKKPIVSDEEIGKMLNYKEGVPSDPQMLTELLHRMRDSAPEWIDGAGESPTPGPSPGQSTDIKTQFEKLAGETSFFDFDDAFYERTDSPYGGDGPEYRAFLAHVGYRETLAHFRSIHATKDELIPLLKHADPKVRTLAIAALASLDDPAVLPFIADLLSDDAITFSKTGGLDSKGALIGQTLRLRTDVTVGENAREVLVSFLAPAGYLDVTRKEFDDYWSKHQGRAYCASWFAERLERSYAASQFDVEKPRIRADLEKVPQPDQTWIALWLKCSCGSLVYSDEELVDMCRKLGPDALMTALKEQLAPSDDPDLPYGTSDRVVINRHFAPTTHFILQNAAALLRPADASMLLTLNAGKNRNPWWVIAAAHLQPAKAVELLRSAYAQFPESWDRIMLGVALWQLGGESQTPLLVDQFYEDETAAPIHPGTTVSGFEFINAFAKIDKPPGVKLIASILQDKRSTTIETDGWAVAALADMINDRTKKQIVSGAEIWKARENKPPVGITPSGSANLPLIGELLHRERDSAPEWNN